MKKLEKNISKDNNDKKEYNVSYELVLDK